MRNSIAIRQSSESIINGIPLIVLRIGDLEGSHGGDNDVSLSRLAIILDELSDLPEHAEIVRETPTGFTDWRIALQAEHMLISAIKKVAPPYTYFGRERKEGFRSSLGFYLDWNKIQEGFVSHRLIIISDDMRGLSGGYTGHALQGHADGSVTLWDCSTGGYVWNTLYWECFARYDKAYDLEGIESPLDNVIQQRDKS